MGEIDICRLADIPEMARIHRSDDRLDLGRMAQDPGDRDGGLGYAVLLAELTENTVQLGQLGIIDKTALEKAFLQRRPCLNGDVVQTTVIERAVVTVDRALYRLS